METSLRPVWFNDDEDLRYLMGYMDETSITEIPMNKLQNNIEDDDKPYEFKEYKVFVQTPKNIKKSPRKVKKNINQEYCCIKDCRNYCSNRLISSIEVRLEEINSKIQYKRKFLSEGMNRICNSHYFSVLYKWNKHKRKKKMK